MIEENNPALSNPLGINGLEFIEYSTSQPQVLGSLLQKLGFRPIARHRSREVTLYRQGSMNLVVNAHSDLRAVAAPLTATPVISAIALRVRDAGAAWQHACDLGAWEIPTHASAMELNIPGIRGVDDSYIYFVDRYENLTIYDVDFVALPDVNQHPPAVAGLHYFGVVQTIYSDRTPEWIAFYRDLFSFSELPGGKYFGVLPKGTLLESPCHTFYLQLIEPPPGAEEVAWDERLVRIGLGTPDVPEATRALAAAGVVFVDRGPVQPNEKGALTQIYLGGVTFELVHSHLQGGGSERAA
ncbi:MAG: 4-hydroxyphenylpyruvate dioxygenase [Pseudomonadota bacterium]|nr:4-hydroxyphenylpyruvate dioxygenase [Pseudomonadota bacterium]